MVSIPLAQQNVNIVIRYFVTRWGKPDGYCWLSTPIVGREMPWSLQQLQAANEINIPIDPLTAIGLGLVTPEELEYPPGILAAFNLLKGN